MPFRFPLLALTTSASLCALAHAAHAQEVPLAPVTVSAARVDLADRDAPYASEVHTHDDLQRAGASSLYDYLAQHSSLLVLPSYGNRFAPKIGMRGFGADGFSNLVITVNGRRLNNIDSVPQLIGSIALADIERIEITKGSGAVVFGDGAAAGTIQIYTHAQPGASVEAYTGSAGQRGGSATAALARERFGLSASHDRSVHAGSSAADATGQRDRAEHSTWRVAGDWKATPGLRLDAEVGASHFDLRFPAALTLAQYLHNPGMLPSATTTYVHQTMDTRHWSLGLEYQLHAHWLLRARHHQEAKRSLYGGSTSATDYDHRTDELSLQYSHHHWTLSTGLQRWSGQAAEPGYQTTKRNLGLWVHGQYQRDAWTVSAGARHERVAYRHRPSSGTSLAAEHHLPAWELGLNRRLSPQWSVFGNLSSAFVAPHIDRFFEGWGASRRFNDFIAPTRAQTLTLGGSQHTPRRRLKLSVFYSQLQHEMYWLTSSYTNTNFDRSHKYGLELQHQWQHTARIRSWVNYTWTRALIDREDQGQGAYNGKALPGVPRHSLGVGLGIQTSERGQLQISHQWRSSAWAEEDFANAFQQKQQAFHSTDLSYRYQVAAPLEVFAGVSNLLGRKNGFWVRDDAIYPMHFVRTWKLGARWNY